MHKKHLASLRYLLIGRRYFEALRALNVMLQFHGGDHQVRKDGKTPEFFHPLQVALLVSTLPNLIYPEYSIAAALLHDVPEEYWRQYSHSDIRANFNQLISRAVELMDKSMGPSELRYGDMKTDPIASIVKPCDRIINNSTMFGVLTPDRINVKLVETRDVILPTVKVAKREFPEQTDAYELIKFMLTMQLDMVAHYFTYEKTDESTT